MKQALVMAVMAGLLVAAAGCGGGKGEDEDGGDTTDVQPDETEDTAPDAEEDPDAEADVSIDEVEEPPDDSALDFDWEPPEMPDRYAWFQAQQISSSGQRMAMAYGDSGDYSAVTPTRPLWADADCTVTPYPPAGGSTGFVRLSAGTPVTMTGGTGTHAPIECTFDPADGYSCDVPATSGTTIYAAGDTITTSGPGDDIPAFGFDVVAPPAPSLLSSASISKSAGYTVSWSEIDADSIAIMIVSGEYDFVERTITDGNMVQCILDLGDPPITEFAMPLPALSLLENSAMGPEFIVGFVQIMGLNGASETLTDGSVVEVILLNGTGAQATITD